MKIYCNKIVCLALLAVLLQGCAGVRLSYKSLLKNPDAEPSLQMNVGDAAEVLAIGNGFPGWWGYYPWMISAAPEIASIECENTRSFIPFREPGVLFGGTVCRLVAHQKGDATLYFGNKFNLGEDAHALKIAVVVEDE